MRITLRWGRNRDHQLVALLGCSGVRVVRVGGFRHHAAQFDDGDGEVRPLLLRYVRGRSLCGGMGDGADTAVAALSRQLSALGFLTSNRQTSSDVQQHSVFARKISHKRQPSLGYYSEM